MKTPSKLDVHPISPKTSPETFVRLSGAEWAVIQQLRKVAAREPFYSTWVEIRNGRESRGTYITSLGKLDSVSEP
jgi:hypothetical protein